MPSGVNARIAIFASGAGSNADKICTYFNSHPSIQVNLIVSNRHEAGVMGVADRHHIDTKYISKKNWTDPSIVIPVLEQYQITHIVLAGFLLLIPDYLTHAYPGRIINIHPALLPQYGGQGMYGHHVHEAVRSSGDLISGITIHEVNERFDEGRIIFQKEVLLDKNDSADVIARKVLQLEHAHYPEVIEQWIGKVRS